MIISASRRTDIPCYYSEWLLNRLKAGYVLVRNPMNANQVSRINLCPDVVDGIVLWTKDPANILPHLETIRNMGYPFYFQYTLTPYDKSIETNLQDKNELVDTFIQLSKTVGKERVLWRYDPIILNDTLTVQYHKEAFLQLCEKLSPFTESVTISFVDLYKKMKTNQIRSITEDEMVELSLFISQTATEHGLVPKACCEAMDLSRYGIQRASCIDKTVIEKICGCPLDLNPDKNQREGCGCVESIDIGAYNTCMNGCIYCYANDNPESTQRRFQQHDPKSEMLFGGIKEGEVIKERKVISNKIAQIKLI